MKLLFLILDSARARILAMLTTEGFYLGVAVGLLLFVGIALIVRGRGR